MTFTFMDSATSLTLLVILGLIVCSGILSGSETALTAASRIRMTKLAEEGSRPAQWVNFLLDRQEQLLSAILLLNNLVNILASVLATSLFLRLLGETGVVYATIVMTVIVVIFAEVLPKTYAISSPDLTAMRVAGLLRILIIILRPFTWILQRISRLTLRLAGVKDEEVASLLAPHDEIRGAIDLHHQEGGVVKLDRDMLGGILDLRSISVSEVMVHRKNMFMIDADLPAQDITQQMLESPYTRVPLWRENTENIVGVLHARDVLKALAASPNGAQGIVPTDIMKPPWFVPETTPLTDQLSLFRREKAHFALVVDEYAALMGLVTMEDILEEIVGHIHDEYDEPEGEVRRLQDGSIEVRGDMSIRDLNRDMGWSLPDEEATTIAGLVIHEARTIPDVGQIFVFHGYRFRVMARQRNQIMMVRISSADRSRHSRA